MKEFFDVVNANDNVIGRASREECHSKGLLHRGSYILIFNSKGQLLMQKRGMKKDLYRGLWDGSASGHVESGSTYEETALKELKEELGIETELKFICKYRTGEGKDREIDAIFVGTHNGPFRLNRDEVERIKFYSPERIKEMIKREPGKFTDALPGALRQLGKHSDVIHHTSTIAIGANGKFLLIQRAKDPNRGRWEFPGGHVDRGETPKQAAQREASEEVGPVRIGKHICTILHSVGPNHHHICHAFKGELNDEVRISKEALAYGWFARRQMEKMHVADFTLKIIDSYLTD
ncbi:NUDIX domain-containing protein [Candidatus Woesearchaeota archaeon]|nr:NUDIX domain-containing protein [Candidatus Woesearchaeota archaeon]